MARAEFAILGAGAIGSIIAAHLARAGRSVVVLARGARASELERSGLRIRGLSDISVRVPVLTEPAKLGAAEVLIVAMKTPGTAAALEPLRGLELGVALSIQNGVLKDDLLCAAFGDGRVLGALANTSGEVLPSGEVLFTRNVSLPIGELGGGMSARAARIAAALEGAGIRSSAVADILPREWSKFVSWLALVSLAVTTRAATWRYLSDPDGAALIVRLVREAVLLARAQGVALSDEGALLPLGTLVTRSEEEAVAIVRRAGEEFRAGAPRHRMSALQDLEAGRALEIAETFGDAVRRAARLQLSLPLLETFHRLCAAIDRSARPGA
jgi:2-dehydropantoate 2-reductase